MAQASDEEKYGSNGKTRSEYDKADKNYEPFGIEARDALNAFLKNKSNNKLIAVCKYHLLKESNDIHHIVGSACLCNCQSCAFNACANIIAKKLNVKYTSKQIIVPIWRVSGSTFIVIIDESDKNDFKKLYDTSITMIHNLYDSTPSYSS